MPLVIAHVMMTLSDFGFATDFTPVPQPAK
jgi:hypothetical protein